MKQIQPPDIWKQFAFGFIQDFDLLYEDIDSYKNDFLNKISRANKSELKKFLNYILDKELDSDSFKMLFFSYGANFCPNECEKFMRELRKEL